MSGPLVSVWVGVTRHLHWLTHRSVRAWATDAAMPGILTRCELACAPGVEVDARALPMTIIEQAPVTHKPLTTLEEVDRQSPQAKRVMCPWCFP